ncbi:hypothetical protein [Dietzia sp. PP-33]|jgi:hypothetical protein|uniref:hypothetical protein n=1 Tax=Dietzia sp. PP-33 TaxID=2957500 RepID=UPI0029BBA7C7|nr:hypothetical protein [Dietzia sp. PP-33]MDX2355905.1 hypothetical protein [Dietzia sp. PP-33]
MSDSSSEVRLTSEMKIHDDVTIDRLRSILADVSRGAAAEGDHIRGHNFYLDEGARILFAHEHYRDADAMLTHLAEMDQAKVGELMSTVDVLDLRIYGPVNTELRELLEGFGSPRTFEFVSGFTHLRA